MSTLRLAGSALAVATVTMVACDEPLPGLEVRPTNQTCRAPTRPPPTAPVAFERVFADVALNVPLVIAQIPGDPSRWFAAQRDGTIVSFAADGSSPAQPVGNVATLAGLPVNQDGEGGLLGFAFHPKFADNGKAYVSWTTTGSGPSNMRSLVGVLHSPDQGASFDSHAIILGPFDQPYYNHNGGGVVFGTDGLLYLSFGDGGTPDTAQDPYRFFSKILRIDVDNVPAGQRYGIPADNPFASGGGEPTTFARGFRNPYRFSIDRATGELWVADVGQNAWEEVDRVALGGNYGWPCREGSHDYLGPPYCPSAANIIDPVVEHAHTPHRSITGGVVYRGTAIPGFVGSYVYGDYLTQELFTLSFDPITGAAISNVVDGAPAAPWGSFAEDADGEVYAVALSGAVYKMVAAAGRVSSTFPERLSQTGCVDPLDPTRPAEGLIPYTVNAGLWSDGATKERFLAIPDDTTIAVSPVDGDFDLPVGSALMKTFSLDGHKVETRLFVRHEDGEWAGYSYEWLDDQSDAVLLPASKAKRIGDQTWMFPGRSDCVRCHTEAAGHTLGLEIQQLNGELTYATTGRTANQLATLAHIGLIDPKFGETSSSQALPDPFGKSGSLDRRARAYLHANCSNCHRPGGGARGSMNLTFATPLGETSTCNSSPEVGDLGIPDAKLVTPGVPELSLLSLRPRLLGANRMPPLATHLVDAEGTTLVDEWIRSLEACP